MEVFKSLPEGTLAELIDNVIYMSPTPVTNHQKVLLTIARRLSEQLDDLGKGQVIIAPFDVYLDETSNAVEPDIVVILKTNKDQPKPKGHFHGVPDLLVEVLSPGNREHDLVKKKNLYEKFGVREYWIVDPQSKAIVAYTLVSEKYESMTSEPGTIHSLLLNIAISF
ncbi:MAG TPA: Uma2 family endonuclease [Chryseolinea sp.]